MQAIIDAINDNKNFFAGTENVQDVAQEWLDSGLTTDESLAYMQARCFTAWAAIELKAAGVTPNKASEHIQIAGYRDTIGYAVANGDLAKLLAKLNQEDK